jgi:hypothetical protein
MKGPLAAKVRDVATASMWRTLAPRSPTVRRFAPNWVFRADAVVVGTVANFRPQKDYPNLLAARIAELIARV